MIDTHVKAHHHKGDISAAPVGAPVLFIDHGLALPVMSVRCHNCGHCLPVHGAKPHSTSVHRIEFACRCGTLIWIDESETDAVVLEQAPAGAMPVDHGALKAARQELVDVVAKHEGDLVIEEQTLHGKKGKK